MNARRRRPVAAKESGGRQRRTQHSSSPRSRKATRNGALDHAKFGYDNRVQGGDKTMFYASASIDELQLAADALFCRPPMSHRADSAARDP